MFPNFLLLSCLFLTVEYNHGQVLPPRNVSLRTTNDFYFVLSWIPPENFVERDCFYSVATDPKKYPEHIYNNFTHLGRKMEGGFLNVSIKTVCNNLESEPVVISETNPELVTDFQCYVHSATQTNCSWSPTSVAADLHMFHRYAVELESKLSETEECSLYIYTEGVKTGCSLPVTSKHSISILFNTTLNNKTVRNIFHRNLIDFVRPPVLNWSVEKSWDEFNIRWDSPGIFDLRQWTFIINYTQCNLPKSINATGVTSYQLSRVSRCQYSMTIKAKSDDAETPWSNTKNFDADSNALVYLAVIIPLVITTLTILGVVCYQKNKANIFPQIPEPRDLLSDICDNNNKITLCNFHVPAVEEDSCKIALVIDPQISKLDS